MIPFTVFALCSYMNANFPLPFIAALYVAKMFFDLMSASANNALWRPIWNIGLAGIIDRLASKSFRIHTHEKTYINIYTQRDTY